jgi:hypothetical protein
MQNARDNVSLYYTKTNLTLALGEHIKYNWEEQQLQCISQSKHYEGRVVEKRAMINELDKACNDDSVSLIVKPKVMSWYFSKAHSIRPL